MSNEPTALEKKWQEEPPSTPVLEDSFNENGEFEPDRMDSSVFDRIPNPTGWRIVLLPYRGVEKSKGGIVCQKRLDKKLN